MAFSRMPKWRVRPLGAALPLRGSLALGMNDGAGHRDVVGLGEVGGAAPQLGEQHLGERVEHLAGRAPGRQSLLGVGVEDGRALEAVGQPWSTSRSSSAAALEVSGPASPRLSCTPCGRPCRACPRGRGQARPCRPRTSSGSKPSTSGRRRCPRRRGRAVRLAGAASLVGGGPGDDRVQDRASAWCATSCLLSSVAEQGVDVLGVVVGAGRLSLAPVDVDDLPAVGLVALGGVLAERDVGVVLDGDLVRVVHDREVAELLVARQGEASG